MKKGLVMIKIQKEEKPGRTFEKVNLQSNRSLLRNVKGGNHCLNGNKRNILWRKKSVSISVSIHFLEGGLHLDKRGKVAKALGIPSLVLECGTDNIQTNFSLKEDSLLQVNQ